MTQWWNGLGVLVALMCATLAGVDWAGSEQPAPRSNRSGTELRRATLPNGEVALLDASDQPIPLRPFQRIVSASTVADGLLLEFAEPNRIVAYSDYGVSQGWQAHRFAGKARVTSLNDVEAILALEPDLVLASVHGSPQQAQRLREAGVAVFNLGEMRGIQSLLRSMHTVATLCGRPELGERYAQLFMQRLQRISVALPGESRRTALYAAQVGGRLYGSGRNTNYADVLSFAGLIDLGSQRYEGFPEYGSEQLLELDPDLIVTRLGQTQILCRYAGLDRLRACQDPARRIVELPESVISSAGVEMLVAAEWLHELAYPPQSQNSPK